ncbi:hypothetical protein JCM10450v2_007408 [Rhodotorula kratochvilovae]
MGDKPSYAAATAAYAPSPPAQPDPAFLDSLQPANQRVLDSYRDKHVPAQPNGDRDERSPAPEKREGKKEVNGDESEWAAKGLDQPGAPFKTTLKGHHAMENRPISEDVRKERLAEPYVPRANIAATPEHPQGTVEGGWADSHQHQSVLQQHCAWWDPDGDGIIWPWNTFWGFHELGYALPWCILAIFIIHPGFSWFTSESWLPHPLLPINVNNIHRAKHGSDTGVYDTEGRFVPARFEAMFEKYDRGHKGGLTFTDGLRMLHGNRNIVDPVGWTGAFFELVATYLLLWPKDGVMRKEDWRVVYDGSIFGVVAARERERVEAARRSSLFFRLLALLPLNGILKENRAQTDVEYKHDKDVAGKGTYWREKKYRGRY